VIEFLHFSDRRKLTLDLVREIQAVHALAVEEARNGIRTNIVCPGSIDAGMLKPTMGEIPEEITEVVWFTASERASYIIGSVILADGGAVAS
jgi:3-oxoacyl-[acyl-carrier protein] reductase